MKFFLSPPKFLGVFLGKFFNFPQKNTPCQEVTKNKLTYPSGTKATNNKTVQINNTGIV